MKTPKKIPLKSLLAALDSKNMDFWDNCTKEQQKEISLFVLNRFMSLIQGMTDLQEYYLIASNQYVNSHYFALSRHPKLIWQLLCTVSPGMGNHYHKWIGNQKNKSDNKNKNVLKELHPNMKNDDIDTLAEIMNDNDIKEMLNAHGID